MGMDFAGVKKLLLIDIPTLPASLKFGASAVMLVVFVFTLLILWRPASTIRELNPSVSKRLEEGVTNFFLAQWEHGPDPAYVFGEAKAIVIEFQRNSNKMADVSSEIERRKREDNNWTYANRLAAGQALVSALGLTPETVQENEIFLQLPLPAAVGEELNARRSNKQ